MRSAAAGAWLLAAHAAVNARVLRTPGRSPDATTDARSDATTGAPRVSVLVPARDEADRIGACVAAVLASRDVDMEVVVLDDCSSDATAAVAQAAGGGDTRLRVERGATPPPGWLGKPHACHQLARRATGDVLVFLDADVLVHRDGLARTVATLDTGPLDLVCPYPRQVVDGAATRVVQPLLQWSWLTFLPLRIAERSPRASLVAANGQLMACRRDDYWAAGGHAVVRDAVLEDVELGRAFTRVGLRAGVVSGHEVALCAMYDGWSQLREGYTKSLWAAFGSPSAALGVAGLLTWLYVAPAVAAVAAARRGDRRALGWATTAYAGGVAGRMVSAARTGGLVGDAVAHPLSIASLAWLVVSSLRRRRRDDLAWRGRPVEVRP